MTDAELRRTGIHEAARSVALGLSHDGNRRAWSFGRDRPRAASRFRIASLTKPFTAAATVPRGPRGRGLLGAARGGCAEPGKRWSYDNGNYFVAGAVLAELAGTTYEQALTEFVLQPWALDDTGFESSDDLVIGVREG